MKQSHICPKCQHNRLLYLTQIADRVGDLGGGRMDHGTERGAEVAQFYPWKLARMRNPEGGFFESHVMAAGHVEAFICGKCGYTELYTRDLESIVVDGEIVREVVGPEPSGPYR